ncbi:MAG: hypothetical protein ACR2NB_01595 [Solirubrobacteraceae bacterium]
MRGGTSAVRIDYEWRSINQSQLELPRTPLLADLYDARLLSAAFAKAEAA